MSEVSTLKEICITLMSYGETRKKTKLGTHVDLHGGDPWTWLEFSQK